MSRNQLAKQVAVCAAGAMIFSVVSSAGDLDPPTGPVGSTMKTLEQMEPRVPIGPDTTPGSGTATYRIAAPGSYYLVGDVTGEFGKNGIWIDASDVSIDLRGFTVRGVPGSFHGIGADSFVRRARLANGKIVGWGSFGVALAAMSGSEYEGLIVNGNGEVGFSVGGASVVRACVANENGLDGFAVNGLVVFDGCDAEFNGAHGFVGGGTFLGCASVANTLNGFHVSVGSLSNCLAHGNTGTGFVSVAIADGVSLINCTARFNAVGFETFGPASLANCSAVDNSTDGFLIGGPSELDSCLSAENGDDGYQFDVGATATSCASRFNAFGFFVAAGAANVRLDSCSATSNTNTGFLWGGGSGLVVRNLAMGNGTDYLLSGAAMNGPIVSATGTIASTSPWANFGNTGSLATAPDPAVIQRKSA